MQEHEKPWNPLNVIDVAKQFASAPFPWWIAGGYAIELAVGEPVRLHSDIDVLVLRQDHLQTREFLSDWDCWVADPPGVLRFWPVGHSLDSVVHDVWCRKTPNDEWRLQIMLDESADGSWMSRRDVRVNSPIKDITRKTEIGVQYLAPHIQLFYKAKNIREKDQIDFDAVIDSQVALDGPWLREAIEQVYGSQHPWLERIPD